MSARPLQWGTPREPPASARPLADVYDAAYTGVPNWDIGRPQRAFVALTEAGRLASPILDVGCGTGELSLFLSQQGYDVLGIDVSPRAIEQARAKARWRRNRAQFLVQDALRLDQLADRGFRFRTVLDCAMFHVLGDAEREQYIDSLETVLVSGGTCYILGDARRDSRTVYGITPTELTQRFGTREGWDPLGSYETVFERRYATNRAFLVGARRR